MRLLCRVASLERAAHYFHQLGRNLQLCSWRFCFCFWPTALSSASGRQLLPTGRRRAGGGHSDRGLLTDAGSERRVVERAASAKFHLLPRSSSSAAEAAWPTAWPARGLTSSEDPSTLSSKAMSFSSLGAPFFLPTRSARSPGRPVAVRRSIGCVGSCFNAWQWSELTVTPFREFSSVNTVAASAVGLGATGVATGTDAGFQLQIAAQHEL